jgi:hypothetical protein
MFHKTAENYARRIAQKAQLIARKSRRGRYTFANQGGFMLVDLFTNIPVAGFNYDLTPQEVIDYCQS